jgi:hypothetical protein
MQPRKNNLKARIGIKPSQNVRNSVATVSSDSIDINPILSA